LIEILSLKEGIYSVGFTETIQSDEDNFYLINETKDQLKRYFRGTLSKFNLPLKLNGTDFERQVWYSLLQTKYGEVLSYKDIAELIGDKSLVRAVGNANRKNKLMIIIPCHRIIGSNGQLTGYAGELWRKEWLLNHERSYSSQIMQLDLFSEKLNFV